MSPQTELVTPENISGTNGIIIKMKPEINGRAKMRNNTKLQQKLIDMNYKNECESTNKENREQNKILNTSGIIKTTETKSVTQRINLKNTTENTEDISNLNIQSYIDKQHRTLSENKHDLNTDIINKQKIITTQLNDNTDTPIFCDSKLLSRTEIDRPDTIEPTTDNNSFKGDNWKNKQKSDFRIYYQNINSLSPQNQGKWKSTISQSKHLQNDLIGLTETSVNWNQQAIKDKFERTLHRGNRNNRIFVSSTVTKHKSANLPGGTATYIQGRWESRVVESANDFTRMGR
jgi:hypothetical protein